MLIVQLFLKMIANNRKLFQLSTLLYSDFTNKHQFVFPGNASNFRETLTTHKLPAKILNWNLLFNTAAIKVGINFPYRFPQWLSLCCCRALESFPDIYWLFL